MGRRSLAGGAKKRPTRYAGGTTSEPLARALRAHRKGALVEAIAGYRAVLDAEPGSLDATVNLGTALVQAGCARAAEAAFVDALTLGATDARAQRDVGIGLSAIGRHEAALRALGEAVRLDPSLDGARLFAARVAHDAGDRDAAEAWARAAALARPRDASTHLELHRVLFDDRAPGPCIDAASRAVEVEPEDGVGRFFLGAALDMVGERTRAEVLLAGPTVSADRRDALSFVAERRGPSTRYWAHRRDTLRYALSEAGREGDTVELGVRHGVSLRWIADSTPTSVHGFDSFEGLPTDWLGRAPGAFSTAGEVPDVASHVTLHVGLFADTLPAFARSSSQPLRLLHVDSDLHESAATGLALLGHRIARGTVLVFDEYLGNVGWRHEEHRALVDAAATFGWRLEHLAFSWITGQAVIRIG